MGICTLNQIGFMSTLSLFSKVLRDSGPMVEKDILFFDIQGVLTGVVFKKLSLPTPLRKTIKFSNVLVLNTKEKSFDEDRGYI